MTSILHTKEQGLRVHQLANLGGLVAIAGLENIEPALLLGCLMKLAEQLTNLPLHHITQLRTQGLQKLCERKAEKRRHQSCKNKPQEHTEIPIKKELLNKIIQKLGGKAPTFDKDILPELQRIIGK